MFAGQDGGTYVDVGGGHPVAEQRVVLVLPRGLARPGRLSRSRRWPTSTPTCDRRDHAVSCLAGRVEGEAEFHVVEKLHGFSSTLREHAEGAAEFGAAFTNNRQAGADAGGADSPRPGSKRSISSRSTWRAQSRGAGRHGFRAPPPARESCWRRWPPAAWPTHRRPGSAISWPRAISFVFFDRLNRFYIARRGERARRAPAARARALGQGRPPVDCGRAPERSDSPRSRARQDTDGGFFATLPSLEPTLLRRIIERGPEWGQTLRS